MPRPAILL
jgi:hypothetical protein